MQLIELVREGERVMTVCNACRYCEQYCPVFPAMESRLTFTRSDLVYLANLCHNCGECLYACQYAPPHEFGINVPRTLAKLRAQSYEDYCWPPFLGAAFRRNGVMTSLLLSAALIAAMFATISFSNPQRLWPSEGTAEFYAVIPHNLMVGLFGGVWLFILAALAIGVRRFWREMNTSGSEMPTPRALGRAISDVLTLRHLQGGGVNCPSAEAQRLPWRRWFHHCTFYGFMLCFASTSVAAVYHSIFGWHAPYEYGSLPVVLGTAGGLGLLVGPGGLFLIRGRRDPALADAAQSGLDVSFLTLLFLTSFTGLTLLVLRERAAMGLLLIVHLGTVLALFLTLPYGKFVHGIYRTAALIRYATETARQERPTDLMEPSASTAPDRHKAPTHVESEQPISYVKVP